MIKIKKIKIDHGFSSSTFLGNVIILTNKDSRDIVSIVNGKTLNDTISCILNTPTTHSNLRDGYIFSGIDFSKEEKILLYEIIIVISKRMEIPDWMLLLDYGIREIKVN